MGFAPAGKQFCIASLCLTVFAAASVASAQILPLNPSRYRIITAPEFSTGWAGSARAFVWVDNERLLFLANDQQLSTTEQRDGRRVVTKAVPTIHLWDFRAETIIRYRDEPLANYLCAIDGRVYYGLYRDGKKVMFDGVFGQEREQPESPLRLDHNGRLLPRGFNRLSCQEYWYADVPRPHRGRVTLLRAEHGTLEQTGSVPAGVPAASGSEPFKWWNNLGQRSTEIPFPQEWVAGPIAYSKLASGYLFFRRVDRVERGVANRFYFWMPESGVVRTLDILGSANWSALYLPRITREGLVAQSMEPKRNRRGDYDLGPQGVYLFKGAPVQEFVTGKGNGIQTKESLSIEQIASGLVEQLSDASPDGCKVAMVLDPWNKPNRQFRLETVDFCDRAG